MRILSFSLLQGVISFFDKTVFSFFTSFKALFLFLHLRLCELVKFIDVKIKIIKHYILDYLIASDYKPTCQLLVFFYKPDIFFSIV
jgi:hypothetical protein